MDQQLDNDTPLPTSLDTEIATLRSQIDNLNKRRRLLRSTLLSHPRTHYRLTRRSPGHNSSSTTPLSLALKATTAQKTLNLHNLHRILAPATSFLVHDPDPNAPDNGRVLGIRFDISMRCSDPAVYHVFLRRDTTSPTSRFPTLQLHKHTVPALISIERIYDTHFPLSSIDSDSDDPSISPRRLLAFIKAVRHTLTEWHRRQAAITRIKQDLGLLPELRHGINHDQSLRPSSRILQVLADPSVLELRFVWEDGRLCRARVSQDGRVERVVVMNRLLTANEEDEVDDQPKERDNPFERWILSTEGAGKSGQMEGLGARIMSWEEKRRA